LGSIDALVVAEWLKGGVNLGSVPALRAMFNDARRPQAGMLDRPQPVRPARTQALEGAQARAAARTRRGRAVDQRRDELTPPSLAAYVLTACHSAMRPGKLDALKWEDRDFTPGAETITIARQWNVKTREMRSPAEARFSACGRAKPVPLRIASARTHAASRSSTAT